MTRTFVWTYVSTKAASFTFESLDASTLSILLVEEEEKKTRKKEIVDDDHIHQCQGRRKREKKNMSGHEEQDE